MQHFPNYRDNCRLKMRIKGVDASDPIALNGEVVADAKNDRPNRRDTCAVELNATTLKKLPELERRHAFEQSVFIRIMRVERRPIQGCSLGEILNRNLFEALDLYQLQERIVQKSASSPNPWV